MRSEQAMIGVGWESSRVVLERERVESIRLQYLFQYLPPIGWCKIVPEPSFQLFRTDVESWTVPSTRPYLCKAC